MNKIEGFEESASFQDKKTPDFDFIYQEFERKKVNEHIRQYAAVTLFFKITMKSCIIDRKQQKEQRHQIKLLRQNFSR